MTTRTICVLLAVAALLCACHGVAPGPIIGGIAGGVAVLDQLLAGGIIDPVQHHQLATALTDAGQLATSAINLANQTKDVVEQVKAGAVTENEVLGYGGSALLAALGVFNKYRNLTRKAEIPVLAAAALGKPPAPSPA